MLGLDRGGACRGITSGSENNHATTVGDLREHEQVTSVIAKSKRRVWLADEAPRRVSALAYVVDHGHVQYAGRLSPWRIVAPRAAGHGQSGIDRDYVLRHREAIEAEGFRDPRLHQLAG